MKLALIGGGGVRAPEFARGLLAFAADLDLQELWLMDIAADRLEVIVPLVNQIVQQAGTPFKIFSTIDLDEALRDADVIVTSMRVGFEQGRALDERIALARGVLGQETTGAGGFSMAMRSIPELLKVAERAEKLAPRAWIFNFTNPAGLVTQALRDSGFQRVVGICDSANTAQHAIADWLGVDKNNVKTEVFGLNHLSWARRAVVHGRDVLPELLNSRDFVHSTHLRFFGTDFVGRLGLFPNEYLFYFYFRDVALARIKAEDRTRGEEIQTLNEVLYAKLRDSSPDSLLTEYKAYNRRRSATYMAYAESDETLRAKRMNPENTDSDKHRLGEVGGYAGVALRTVLALSQDRPLRIGLNVPNSGAINGLQTDDVVEVTCLVDGHGIHPVSMGDVDEDPYLLMRVVKRYERLAAQAILNRDRNLAVEALVAHPLVGSYALGHELLDDYLEAHRQHVGEWS